MAQPHTSLWEEIRESVMEPDSVPLWRLNILRFQARFKNWMRSERRLHQIIKRRIRRQIEIAELYSENPDPDA